MGNDPQPWGARPHDDLLVEPEKFLAELGWSPAGRAPALKTAEGESAQLPYCSFCWCALPPGAEACHECGLSLAEMEVARLARAKEDRTWLPPSRRKEGEVPAPAASSPGRLFTARPEVRPEALNPSPVSAPSHIVPAYASPAPVHLSWKHVLLAVGAGGFVGGATVAGLWVVVQTFGSPVGAAGGGNPYPSPSSVALSPARLTWKNPVSELRLELVTPAGVVVADSLKDRPGKRLEPGAYRLRVTDNTGTWSPPEEQVLVAPGEELVTGPSPRVVAGYYLWAGKKLYDEQKLTRASRVWTKAVNVYPEGSEARLQLAALLAVRYRYKEARSHLRLVLQRDPANAEALRLMKTLEALEAAR